MTTPDPHAQWSAICQAILHGTTGSEAVLAIVGPRVLQMEAALRALANEPDVTFSHRLTIQDLLQPAASAQWPVHQLTEYRWILGETLSGGYLQLTSPTDIWLPAYMALLLLHCESSLGLELPRAPLCVSVLCEAAQVVLDRKLTAALIGFLASEMTLRLAKSHNDPTEWLTPLAAGIAMLQRTWGAQLIIQGNGSDAELSAPWQLYWREKQPCDSRIIWQRIMQHDTELTQLLDAWATDRQIDF